MKKRAIALTLCFAAFLCGCNLLGNDKNSENDLNVNDTYFDVSQLETNIQKSVLDVNFTDFKYDDKSRVFFTFDTYTLTPSYFLINMRDHKIWVDLSTGRVQSVCDIPGCDHSINTKGCLEHENGVIQDVRGALDGVYFQSSRDYGKLFFKDDSGKRIVFENDFFTEYEERIVPDAKTVFSYFMRDDIMYVMGHVYMYMVDMKTMTKIGEPFILSTSPIWDSDVSNDFFWIANENLELICCNTKNGEVTKIDDKVSSLRCSGSMLYYTKLEGNGANMYVRSTDDLLSGERLILENINQNYYVTDNSIYYTTGSGVYKCDLNGENREQIPLSFTYNCGEKYRTTDYDLLQFISNSRCDSIFLVDYDHIDQYATNAIFVIKKDRSQYQTINLGIWEWVPNNPDGKVKY